MGCLSRIAELVLAVCFFGILFGVPQIMESPTMPWEDKAIFVGLGLFVDLLMIGAALLMRLRERSMPDRPLPFRR